MGRLRFYFLVFSVLLALPVAVLLWRTYSSLEKEAFFFYRTIAEGVIATASEQFLQSLRREEDRPFNQYRYVYVAERPVPSQEGLNLSPLASFPVESEVPGVLGYFQVEPDGTFQTPLLPAATLSGGIEVPQRPQRIELKQQLASIVEGFRTVRTPDRVREQKTKEEVARKSEALSKLKKNLESNLDLSLDKEYAQKDPDQTAVGKLAETEKHAEESSFFQRRVQKASPMQVEVFEAQFRDEALEEADELRQDDRVEGRAPAAETYQINRRDLSSAGGFASEVPGGADVDPFVAYAVGDQWLVFERKVWWQERRYVQGFVTRLADFVEAFIRPQLENSALPETASYLLFYNGEVIWREPGPQKPDLLYSAALPFPLSDFHLAVTIDELPEGPGHVTANWLAAMLSVFLIGGLFGIYRLTSKQIELSQKKSDFVSAVSHELKSPLTAIRMYGEILMEGWADEDKRQGYYRHIHDESERLSRLIQNVLTLAQLEKSEWQRDLTVLNPMEFVREIAEKLTAQAKRAGFEICVFADGDAKPVRADRDALTQILINLIDNSIKFARNAEDKRIVLTVSQIGRETTIGVRDFGPGIPRKELKKIFEKFYRVEDEMTRTARGTGIGLSLVKMLADSMGAKIDVHNRDPGAEFGILLS